MFLSHRLRFLIVVAACYFTPTLVLRADDPFSDLDESPASVPADKSKSPGAATNSGKKLAEGDRGLCRCVTDSNGAAAARIEKVLDSPLKSNGLEFSEIPLEEVVNLLQEEYGIPIQVNVKALEETGMDPAEPVTVNLRNISLRSALRLMLERTQLTSMIKDEVLIITTPEEAESHVVTCVYDVRNLADKQMIPAGASSGSDFDPLVDAITTCIRTETWKENGGGEAEIRTLEPGLLVVSQTPEVHSEIRAFLNTVREMRSRPAIETGQAEAVPAANKNAAITRAYVLQIWQPENVDKEKTLRQIRELIVQSLPDEQWDGRLDNGQAVLLSIMPDRIVLRHKPSVHAEVQSLLADSGVALPAGAPPSVGGGGVGGGNLGGSGGGFFAPQSNADEK